MLVALAVLSVALLQFDLELVALAVMPETAELAVVSVGTVPLEQVAAVAAALSHLRVIQHIKAVTVEASASLVKDQTARAGYGVAPFVWRKVLPGLQGLVQLMAADQVLALLLAVVALSASFGPARHANSRQPALGINNA